MNRPGLAGADRALQLVGQRQLRAPTRRFAGFGVAAAARSPRSTAPAAAARSGPSSTHCSGSHGSRGVSARGRSPEVPRRGGSGARAGRPGAARPPRPTPRSSRPWPPGRPRPPRSSRAGPSSCGGRADPQRPPARSGHRSARDPRDGGCDLPPTRSTGDPREVDRCPLPGAARRHDWAARPVTGRPTRAVARTARRRASGREPSRPGRASLEPDGRRAPLPHRCPAVPPADRPAPVRRPTAACRPSEPVAFRPLGSPARRGLPDAGVLKQRHVQAWRASLATVRPVPLAPGRPNCDGACTAASAPDAADGRCPEVDGEVTWLASRRPPRRRGGRPDMPASPPTGPRRATAHRPTGSAVPPLRRSSSSWRPVEPSGATTSCSPRRPAVVAPSDGLR